MRATFINLYETLKSKFCQRRNNRPQLNPFATQDQNSQLLRTVKVVRQQPSNNSNAQNPVQNVVPSSNQVIIQEPRLIKQQPQIQPIEPQITNYPTYKKDNYIRIIPQQQQTQTSQEPWLPIYESIDKIESCNKQIKQTIKKITFLEQQDDKRKKEFWKTIYKNYDNHQMDQDIKDMINEEDQDDRQLDSNTLMITYQQDIEDVRLFKYTNQLKDYPLIQFQSYKNIRNLWIYGKKQPNYLIKKMNLKILQKLIAKSFRTLSFGSWLNDQIINGYLQMIQNKSLQLGQSYKILNSFFAQTTFAKSQDLIARALKRKNITNANKIIIAFNNGNHWFFAKISLYKVIVYDSIKKQKQYYLNSQSTGQIFKNTIKFADWFYNGTHTLEIQQNYPQQQNSYDCGMFLLCGIKDIVRDYQNWSFSQYDINYKRVQVAQQLMNQAITGFQF